MREILFRAKRKDNGEWVEGQLLSNNDKSYIICCFELQNDCGEGTDLYATEWYEVIPETVGQYTGLEDKNGKKIFEGDIVNVLFSRPDGECSSTECKIDNITNWELTRFLDLSDQIEIIGSIHDNPELLEG